MRFSATFAAAFLPPPADEPALVREVMDLAGKMKRACDYSVNCAYDSRGLRLTVCGNCRWNSGTGPYVVTRNRKNNHIYDGAGCIIN
ncbi:hypothetical protein MAPG_10232 [Magnaporthiopsis poae ATCC 64411]|uniref:Uncharacterized protein n=1 Tax=Magnaporthiopsis poae (strain ATCC 64411 / 73-15) TaxID=644358 RepID=A0A0C4EC19_MAGP6|nr:hypothetical protein MAPG_10232 [Magnaporthiopsis poae ATCC 64411]